MSDPLPIIASLKRASFSEALERALFIHTDKGETIGKLVPVGPWALGDESVINNIRDWRHAAMDMFLVRFTSTFERTKNYLATLSIAQENRIFFMIYDMAGRHVGHIGMSDIAGEEGELDNVMRGVLESRPGLMRFALATLMDWCFKSLRLKSAVVRVLSNNPRGIDLYAGAGFAKAQEDYLFRRETDGVTFHDVVEKNRSNTDYFSIRMRLTKEAFYRKTPWLHP